MAKINKQEVIQKLIDELNLYPGKDMIPSELADKILAVYQINAGEVAISVPTTNVVKELRHPFVVAPGDIYIVPSTGKFFLTNIWVQPDLSDSDLNFHFLLTVGGVAIKVLETHSLIHTINQPLMMLSLANPIELTPGSKIQIQCDQEYGGSFLNCGLTGYTQD
ncbi:hypothetical protein ES703_70261 [subsurface metagenome]